MLFRSLAPRSFVQDDPGWFQALAEIVGRWAPGMKVELEDGEAGVLLGGSSTKPMVFTGAAVKVGRAAPSLPGVEE